MTGSSFEMKQHIGNLKHVSGAQMIALNIDLEIWPTPPLIFTQGLKSAKFGLRDAVVSKRSNVSLIFFKVHKFNDGPLTS